MTNRRLTEAEQLERLNDALIQDIADLSDEEVFAEAIERFGDPQQEIERLRGLIDGALLRASKTKLDEAKSSLAAYNKTYSNNVVALPMSKKRAVIERFTTQDPELHEKLTLAARKGEGINTENDIEGMFGDLIELGLIDEEGNPR